MAGCRVVTVDLKADDADTLRGMSFVHKAWLEELDAAVQQIVADVVGNGSWADYRNVVGFASGLVWRTAERREDDAEYVYTPGQVLITVTQILERWALGKGWDTSDGQTSVRTAIGIALPSMTGTQTREGYLLASVSDITDAIEARTRLQEPLQRLVISAMLAGLNDDDIRTCALPWRLRDRQPTDRKARAFEAALESGNRTFAYAFILPSDLGT